jgi:hypothetical protein
MRVDNVQNNQITSQNTSLTDAGQKMQQVAQNDFISATRVANDNNQSLAQIGQVLQSVGNMLGAVGQLMNDANNSASPDQLFKDAAALLSSASGLMNGLNNNAVHPDAQQAFQDSQQHLQNAGQALGSGGANGAGAAAQSVKNAGQSAAQGLQAAERGAKQLATRSTSGSRAPRLTSSILRDQLNQKLGAQSQSHRHHNHIPVNKAPSNGDPNDSPISSAPSKPAPAPTAPAVPAAPATPAAPSAPAAPAAPSAPAAPAAPADPSAPTTDPSSGLPSSVTDLVNKYIDNGVNDLLFNKLGLQQSYSGDYSASGSAGKTFGSGVSVDDVKNFVTAGDDAAYGTQGKTLAEGNFNTTVGNINKTAQGDFGTAFVQGSTSIGARGRVFGDVDLQNKEAYIGAEGEVGAHATYSAGYSSPTVSIAGQQIGVNAGVNADAFVGATGNAKLDVSLNGNDPHLSLGGEAFAGARASIQGSVGATINGQTVAEAHGTAEGWAGVGVKGDLDVGFKNGTFTFDAGLGAALGIGGDVDFGFSVNVGQIGKDIASGVEHVVDEGEKGVEDLGNDISNAATTVDKAVTSAAKDVGSAVSTAAKDVGNAVSSAAKSVGNFFKSIF